jgi:hypothetical protein
VKPKSRGQKWVNFRFGDSILEEETVFWPRDLLPRTIKNARIMTCMTYGYDADPVAVRSAVEHVNTFQHSKDLFIALAAQ